MKYLHTDQLSYWELDRYFSNTELVIVGAGIVGYSCALAYRRAFPNARITVLERGYLPSGASTKNAGFACFGSVSELLDDLDQHDEETVFSTVEMRWKGLLELRKLIGDQNLDFFRHGSWDLFSNKQSEIFQRGHDALPELNRRLQEITGEPAIYCVDDRVQDEFGFSGWETSFLNTQEGQLNTGKMMESFHQKVVEAGIHVLFGIEVNGYETLNDSVEVRTNIGVLRSRKLAICTNGLSSAYFPDIDVTPARAQVLITEKIPGLRVRGTFHFDAGFYYFRNIDGRVLFGGGRNLDVTGETSTAMETTQLLIENLEGILRRQILPNQPATIAHRWAGIMGVGPSKKPIVRQLSPNVAIGVRLGGMGVAIGTLIGQQVSALLEK